MNQMSQFEFRFDTQNKFGVLPDVFTLPEHDNFSKNEHSIHDYRYQLLKECLDTKVEHELPAQTHN